MGSTETTLYTIAIYTSTVKIKKIRFVLVCALLADFVRYACFYFNLSNSIIYLSTNCTFFTSFFVGFCRFLSNEFS